MAYEIDIFQQMLYELLSTALNINYMDIDVDPVQLTEELSELLESFQHARVYSGPASPNSSFPPAVLLVMPDGTQFEITIRERK